MTNIRGSYQAAMYEPDDDIPRRNNGVQHHQQHQHHVVNMVPADPVRSRQDLMDFGQTMKSKIKGLTYEDERDHLLNRIADKRPEIIGGTGCPEQDLLSRLCMIVCLSNIHNILFLSQNTILEFAFIISERFSNNI